PSDGAPVAPGTSTSTGAGVRGLVAVMSLLLHGARRGAEPSHQGRPAAPTAQPQPIPSPIAEAPRGLGAPPPEVPPSISPIIATRRSNRVPGSSAPGASSRPAGSAPAVCAGPSTRPCRSNAPPAATLSPALSPAPPP